MPKEKSSLKEWAINIVLMAAAGGVLMWRYNDCKQKEEQAAKRVEEARVDAENSRKKREKDCIETVAEAERNECDKCNCTKCLDEFEACYADKNCRTLSVDTLLADGGPPAGDPARIRLQNRAACMIDKCRGVCTAKK